MVDSGIHSSAVVHPSAVIYPGAVIGAGTEVGPFSVIGPHVVLGERNVLASHVVIEGHTTIGDENHIFQFASVGARPQDLKFKGEESRLEIGNGNAIREYVTLHPGTAGGGMLTKIGDRNLLMACSHVAHDVIMGNRNILANSCALAGHITVGDGVIAGGLSGVHQFVRLGTMSYIGAGSMVSKDVPPFCLVQGDRAGLAGLNIIGMRRAGVPSDVIRSLKQAYRRLFREWDGEVGVQELTLRERAAILLGQANSPQERLFLEFIISSERGVCDLRRGDSKAQQGESSDEDN
jgi:UDP-N-acetylglucosamine acyltransferase